MRVIEVDRSKHIRRISYARPGAILERAVYSAKERFEYSFSGDKPLLCYCERGSRLEGETRLDGIPSSSLRKTSGRFVFIPPGVRLHGWTVRRANSVWANIYFERHEDLARHLRAIDTPILFGEDVAISGTAAKLLKQIETQAPNEEYLDLLVVLLAFELRQVAHAWNAAWWQGGLAPLTERKVRGLIASRLESDIDLDGLCAVADLSRFHFIRAFKITFGMTPHRYLVSQRIDRAKEMLASTDRDVTDIALSVGFATPSHFAMSFRKFVGHSPSEYRRKQRI